MNAATGFDCFLQGARLARARSLRRFVWAPMAISLLVIAALLALGYGAVETAVEWVVGLVPVWLDWLGGILAIMLYALGIVIAGWMFSFLAALLASPLLGFLSARAEREAFGEEPEHDENLTRAITGAVIREARKLAYHLPRMAGVFALTLIPVVNAAAPVFWLAFGAWMLAVQFVDYAAENRGLAFDDTVALLRANRGAALGFGAPIALLLAVPFAALVVIPVAVCGGALLWRRLA